MGLRKTIVAKPLNLIKQLLGETRLVASIEHARDEFFAVVLQPPFALPCRHCAAQAIGFAAAKPSGDHRKLHHLFLKNRHAECSLKHAFDRLAWIANSLSPAATVEVGMHHLALYRARPHNGYLNNEVVITARFKSRQHAHLRA